VLKVSRTDGQGLAGKYCRGQLTVRPRTGGEKCRPAYRDHHHELKKLFQEQRIPPWERERLPLIYVGDQLAAVADLWVCHQFAAAKDKPGYRIDWIQD